jgi:hypothetical protein
MMLRESFLVENLFQVVTVEVELVQMDHLITMQLMLEIIHAKY